MSLIYKNCPKCNFDQPRRVARESWMARKVMPYFGCYPWECPMCRMHFYRRVRLEHEHIGHVIDVQLSQQQF